MGFGMTVSEIRVNIEGHLSKVRSSSFWTFAATEWYRLYQPFVPFEFGPLSSNVRITPRQIEHTSPYGIYDYNGNFNFRKSPHPKASRRWDKAAEPTEKPKLIDSMQAYADSGRLGLSG